MTLAEMGHGDELVIADSNFPATSVADAAAAGKTTARLIRMDGHSGPAVLEAVLTLFPVDTYVPKPAVLMSRVEEDKTGPEPPIWSIYSRQLNAAEHRSVGIECIERFAFYARAKHAFCVIATGESAQYANIILKKGVIAPGKPQPVATPPSAAAAAPVVVSTGSTSGSGGGGGSGSAAAPAPTATAAPPNTAAAK